MLKKARIIGQVLVVPVILLALLGVVYLVTAEEGDPEPLPEVDLSADFALAAQLIEAQEYAQAEEIYRDIIADFPDTDHAFTAQKALAMMKLILKDWNEAIHEADLLIAQYGEHPQLAQALYEIAFTFDREKKTRRAVRYYQACLDHDPSPDLALAAKRHLVTQSARLGDWAAVYQLASELEAAMPPGEELAKILTQIGLGLYAHASQHKSADEHGTALYYFQLAEQMYRTQVPSWPTERRAIQSRHGIINTLRALGREAEAALAEDELMADYACGEGETALAEVLYQLAERHRNASDHPRALHLYQHALILCPGSQVEMRLLVDLARVHLAMNDYSAARSVVDQLRSGHYDHQWSFIAYMNALAWECRKLRMYSDAEAIYRYVLTNLAQDNEAIDCQRELVALKHAAGDKAAAAAELNVLISQFPNNDRRKADALRKLAYHVYEQSKDYQTAADLFHRVMELTPDTRVAQQVMLEYLRVRSRMVETAEEAGEVFQAFVTAVADMEVKSELRDDALVAVLRAYLSFHEGQEGTAIASHAADLLLEALGPEATDDQRAMVVRNVAKGCREARNYAAAANLFQRAMAETSNAQLIQELTIENLNMRAKLAASAEEADEVFESCLAVVANFADKRLVGHHAYAIADIVKAYVTLRPDRDGVPIAIHAAQRLIEAVGDTASVEQKSRILGIVAQGCAHTQAYQTAEELFRLAMEKSPDPNNAQRIMLEYLKMRAGLTQSVADAEEVFQSCLAIINETTNNNVLVHDAIETAVSAYASYGARRDRMPLAIQGANRLIEALGDEAPVNARAMALHARAWALSWNGMYQEAVQEMVALVDAYGDTGDPEVDYLRAVSLGHAYGYCLAQVGDPDVANQYMDRIRNLWPDGRYEKVINFYVDRFRAYEQ